MRELAEFLKIENMKEELTWTLNALGITNKSFAEKYYIDRNDGVPFESDVKMFYEKFKKQLSRTGRTSKVSKQLSDYIFFYNRPMNINENVKSIMSAHSNKFLRMNHFESSGIILKTIPLL